MEKYIKKIIIGRNKYKIELPNNVIIAPMAGITDRSFRNLQYNLSNISLVFNEMVSAKALSYDDEKTWDMLKPFDGEEKRNRGIQLFGSDPEDFAEAIKKIKEKKLNIDIIDINAGCPAPKITKSGSGCFLLKDLENLREIAKRSRAVWDKILSFKIRIGIDEKNIIALDICKILEEEGIDFITIHARTYEGKFYSDVNYEEIKKVKENIKIPIFFNGNIFKFEDAKKALEKTNADGIAIARGAYSNPFLARDILSEKDKKISKSELLKVIEMHFKLNIKYLGEERGTKEFRKNLIWYSRFFSRSNVLRSKISELKDEKSFEIFLSEMKKLEMKEKEEN